MSNWSEFANIRGPRRDDPPPEWLKALRVYPNAAWVVAERFRARTGAAHDSDAASRDRPRRAA